MTYHAPATTYAIRAAWSEVRLHSTTSSSTTDAAPVTYGAPVPTYGAPVTTSAPATTYMAAPTTTYMEAPQQPTVQFYQQ
jgi:hypothetical protein